MIYSARIRLITPVTMSKAIIKPKINGKTEEIFESNL
jgi:hypothetical protein